LNDGTVDTPANAWDQFNDKFNSKSTSWHQFSKKLNNGKILPLGFFSRCL
jgi:hypothetical protein